MESWSASASVFYRTHHSLLTGVIRYAKLRQRQHRRYSRKEVVIFPTQNSCGVKDDLSARLSRVRQNGEPI